MIALSLLCLYKYFIMLIIIFLNNSFCQSQDLIYTNIITNFNKYFINDEYMKYEFIFNNITILIYLLKII